MIQDLQFSLLPARMKKIQLKNESDRVFTSLYDDLTDDQTVKGSYLCSTWLVDGVSPSVFRCTSICHGSATKYRSEMEMQVS